MKPLLIFAGSLRQASAYATENKLPRDSWTFVINRRSLEGLAPLAYDLVKVGNWNENYVVASAYGDWLARVKKAEGTIK